MRTTLDLPEKLVNEALKATHSKTKTELIKYALENIIQQNRISELKHYRGKLDLDINLDELRIRQ